jgi:hypothetical protein
MTQCPNPNPSSAATSSSNHSTALGFDHRNQTRSSTIWFEWLSWRRIRSRPGPRPTLSLSDKRQERCDSLTERRAMRHPSGPITICQNLLHCENLGVSQIVTGQDNQSSAGKRVNRAAPVQQQTAQQANATRDRRPLEAQNQKGRAEDLLLSPGAKTGGPPRRKRAWFVPPATTSQPTRRCCRQSSRDNNVARPCFGNIVVQTKSLRDPARDRSKRKHPDQAKMGFRIPK